MEVINSFLNGCMIIKQNIFNDERGSLNISIDKKILDLIEIKRNDICLQYYSTSKCGVLRGLHYQVNKSQGKLITLVTGKVYDVIVDLRSGSKSFGEHESIILCSDEKYLLWIPSGFAHGFLSLKDNTIMSYSCTNDYSPKDERCIKWDDCGLNIQWPIKNNLLISQKDKMGEIFEKTKIYYTNE